MTTEDESGSTKDGQEIMQGGGGPLKTGQNLKQNCGLSNKKSKSRSSLSMKREGKESEVAQK